MRPRTRLLIPLLVVVLALLVTTLTVAARSGGPYDLWECIGCAGGYSSGGQYVLFSTIGQAAAGPTMNGGTFTLDSGFLAYGDDASVYLPLTLGGR